MRRAWKVGSCAALAILCVLLLGALFYIKREREAEGYRSWEAVRNYIIRDGQISVVLRDGAEIVDVSGEGEISWDGNKATMKYGYGLPSMSVTCQGADGQQWHIRFDTKKLNSWDRVEYRQQPSGVFRRFHNGTEFPDWGRIWFDLIN